MAALALSCCALCVCFFLSVVVSSLPARSAGGQWEAWRWKGVAVTLSHNMGRRILSSATELWVLSAVPYRPEHSSVPNTPDLSRGGCCLLPGTASRTWAPRGSRGLAAPCRDSLPPRYASVEMSPKAHRSENRGPVSVHVRLCQQQSQVPQSAGDLCGGGSQMPKLESVGLQFKCC